MGYSRAKSRGPCKKPGRVNGIPIPCRDCEHCHQAKVDEWTGRARAEMAVSRRTDYITLTYGDDNVAYGHKSADRAKAIYPNDFRLFCARMRKAGHRFKFLATGELGSEKGRAHFHALIFWKSQPWQFRDKVFWYPTGAQPAKSRARYGEHEQDLWRHGYIYPEQCHSGRAVGYVTKYLHKTLQSELHAHSFHKSNAIGDTWFVDQWARLHVDAGIAPKNGLYSFAVDRILRTGARWQYNMPQQVIRKFVIAFRDLWEEERPNDIMPGNDWLWKKLDQAEPYSTNRLDHQRPTGRVPKPTPDQIPGYIRGIRDVFWSDVHNTFCYVCPAEEIPVFWSRKANGEWDWHGSIGTVDGSDSAAAIHNLPTVETPYRRHGPDLIDRETGEIVS